MTETAMGGPKNLPEETFPPGGYVAGDTLGIPRTPGWKLAREGSRKHTLEFTMGNAPAPIAEALRAILPANAQRVTVAITWDGDAPQTIF